MVWTDAETLIKADNLTSSDGVGLGAVSISYGITNNIQLLKRPSTQEITAVGEVRKDYNNLITFSGVIDATQATSTTGGKVSFDLLEDISKSQDPVYVIDEVFTRNVWQLVEIQSIKFTKSLSNIINFVIILIKTK